jgi:hypothetical protein
MYLLIHNCQAHVLYTPSHKGNKHLSPYYSFLLVLKHSLYWHIRILSNTSASTSQPQNLSIHANRVIGEHFVDLVRIDFRYKEISLHFQSLNDFIEVPPAGDSYEYGTIIVFDVTPSKIQETFRCRTSTTGAPMELRSEKLVKSVVDALQPGVSSLHLLIHNYSLCQNFNARRSVEGLYYPHLEVMVHRYGVRPDLYLAHFSEEYDEADSLPSQRKILRFFETSIFDPRIPCATAQVCTSDRKTNSKIGMFKLLIEIQVAIRCCHFCLRILQAFQIEARRVREVFHYLENYIPPSSPLNYRNSAE